MNLRFIIIAAILLLWFLLGAYFFNKHFCGVQEVQPIAKVEESLPVVEKATAVWNIQDGNSSVAKLQKYYQFPQSSFSAVSGDQKFSDGISAVAAYLNTGKDRSLKITGFYNETEENPSILNNLGLARANSIKKILMTAGVSSSQLDIDSKLIDMSNFSSDTLRRGADFTFHELDDKNDRLAEVKARLNGKLITLYFGTNQDQIDLTSEQRSDFTDIIYLIDNEAAANLIVSGHTDNSGSRDANVKLSQSRAQFVKDYLIRNGGLNGAKINASGFGPDMPVASNSYEEGMAQNRRVEVSINY